MTETQPMTEDQEVFYRLGAPVPPDCIQDRPGQGGRRLTYVKPQFVLDRLDEAVGPGNWDMEILMAPDHVLCRLKVTLPSGRVVSRDGIGGYPIQRDGPNGISSEDIPKAGASDAMKRAGVLFGIARNLQEDAATVHEAHPASREPRREYAQERPSQAPPQRSQGGSGSNGNNQPPRTGKALYARVRELEQQNEVALLKYLNGWAKLQDFPGRMIDWDAEQAALGYAEAMRKLASNAPSREPGEDG